MNELQKRRIRAIFSWILTGSILVAGVCLIAACGGIYLSGDKPYSPQAVAAAFSYIAWAVYGCLALTVAGFALQLITGPAKRPGKAQALMLRDRLRARTDLSLCGPTLRADILALRRGCHIRSVVTTVLLCFCSGGFLACAARPDAFLSQDINGSVVRMVLLLAAFLALPAGFGIFTACRNRKAAEQELALLRQAPKGIAPAGKETKSYLHLWRLVFLAAGMGLTAYGLFLGGAGDVLTKAVNICTECIGLG